MSRSYKKTPKGSGGNSSKSWKTASNRKSRRLNKTFIKSTHVDDIDENPLQLRKFEHLHDLWDLPCACSPDYFGDYAKHSFKQQPRYKDIYESFYYSVAELKSVLEDEYLDDYVREIVEESVKANKQLKLRRLVECELRKTYEEELAERHELYKQWMRK